MAPSFDIQTELEAEFTAERVAQVFSVQSVDGTTTGAVDSSSLQRCARMAWGEVTQLLFPVYTEDQLDPVPDAVMEVWGIFTMYRGLRRRPEYNGDPKAIPMRDDYLDARKRLDAMRDARARISADETPANAGGSYHNHHPEPTQPFTFLGNAETGEGGFNSGGF